MGKFRKIFFFFVAIFLGLFGKPIFAFAILDIFLEPIRFIIRVGAGIGLLLLISPLFLLVANSILGWVTMPNFIIVSYTRPDNVIVQYGWTTVRDFTNLLFILVAIIIGIATALRINQYEVRKTLPRLIVIALLINFTPVICGAIIDASNILMNFFLSAGAGGYSTMTNFLTTSTNVLGSAIRNFDVRNLFNGVIIFQSLFIIAFNLIAGFVLLLFAVLLLLRHVALWVLVILSPLAFFCWILPGTKSVWNKWWSQFIQWCFVGVSGAFFLYLSQIVTQRATTGGLFAKPGAVLNVQHIGLRNQISEVLVFSVPIILMVIGMFATMSTSAMGANIVMNLANRSASWGIGATRKLKRWGGNKVSNWATRGLEQQLRRRDQLLRERLAQRHPFAWGRDASGNPMGGVVGWGGRVAANIFTQVLRKVDQLEQKHLSSPTKNIQTQIDKRRQELTKDNVSEEERLIAFRSAANSMERVAAYLALLEKKEHRNLDGDERQRAIREAYNIHYSLGKKAIESDPQFAQQLYLERAREMALIRDQELQANREGNLERERQLRQQREALEYHARREGLLLDENEIRRYDGNIINKIVENATPDKASKWSRQFVTSPDFQNAIVRFGSGSQISALGKEFGNAFVDVFSQRAGQILQQDPDYFYRENYRLYRYSFTNAAQELGMPTLDGNPNRNQARPPIRRQGPYNHRSPDAGAPEDPYRDNYLGPGHPRRSNDDT